MAGLELLYSSVASQIVSANDAIVCYLHWCMIDNDFKCVGYGENVPTNETDVKKSELLPRDWNTSQDCYTLRYQPNSNHDNYLLKAIPIDGTLLVHLMRLKDEKVCNLSIDVNNYVNSQHLNNYESVFKNLDELHEKFETEIISDLRKQDSKTSKGSSTLIDERLPGNQQGYRPYANDPLRAGPPRRPHAERQPEWGEPNNPLDIGTGDLDPFHPGGTGMFMDPMRAGFPRGGIPDPSAGIPGRLPRGAVPPGARFDPFGPPGHGPDSAYRSGPDPDHLPPPGYDDMFG
uniref:Proteasome inhibitor PI31 subunit n=1 Tax=Saccoglossus kowalevskii TaxID=10224 RepID=A0ABM0GL36_SACKO|nr:PREDICTED: proteasome inhibitor PI31 subunit-like [Saccoglossus kowalevskii]